MLFQNTGLFMSHMFHFQYNGDDLNITYSCHYITNILLSSILSYILFIIIIFKAIKKVRASKTFINEFFWLFIIYMI